MFASTSVGGKNGLILTDNSADDGTGVFKRLYGPALLGGGRSNKTAVRGLDTCLHAHVQCCSFVQLTTVVCCLIRTTPSAPTFIHHVLRN